jgi:hypothetical protein
MDDLPSKTLDQGTDDFAETAPATASRPVALRGHMGADRGGYVPENDRWFNILTEPHPDTEFDKPNLPVGRDPMTIPLDVLSASGHPPRRTAQVMSAYRAGMDYLISEGPSARTHKELRAICHECAENRAEIRRCAIVNCPIWPYRMGRNPHNPRRGKDPFRRTD